MAAPGTPAETPAGISPQSLAAVRPQVQAMLTRVPAYAQLSPEEQGRLAHDMVKVLAYMNDPNRVVEEAAATPPPPLAEAQSKANEQTRQNLSRSPGFAGKDFEAGAARQGTEQFVNMVNKVDFAAFVGGLVNNVFKVIVETSIEQMKAYGELVAAVAKTADEYMAENIGMGQGRDYLAQRFPDLVDVDIDRDGASRLKVTSGDEEAALKEIHETLGIPGEVPGDISDDETEAALVNAARLQMAKSRQQLLASMVMLGINRIVVTDGQIKAKVKFDLDTTDIAHRSYQAAAFDRQTSRNRNTSAFGGGFLGFGGGTVNVNEQSHVATVSTKLNETSDSSVELSASLMGEVRVNFKSDYLPLEKMATPEMIGAIQGNAQPTTPRGLARPAGSPAAAPAPAGGAA
ncbi:hypothetical protein ACLBKU_17075 [Erythrobacter sp. NE805]|uniref:hypothetical protein n=1 Tax=Erythrobacter sp. NE805 TaxID=3389875 RepID=UPI00396AFBD3